MQRKETIHICLVLFPASCTKLKGCISGADSNLAGQNLKETIRENPGDYYFKTLFFLIYLLGPVLRIREKFYRQTSKGYFLKFLPLQIVFEMRLSTAIWQIGRNIFCQTDWLLSFLADRQQRLYFKNAVHSGCE